MKLLLVSCTKKSKSEFDETPLGKSLSKHKDIKSLIYYNNSTGLSECYNKAIKQAKQEKYDTIILVHDDVYLTDIFLKEKLEKAFQQYDIVGIAGSSEFKLKQPIVWHNSSRDSWAGAAEHSLKDGNDSDNTYWTFFGPTPKKCIVIDGVFIAINLNKIKNDTILFDEQFTFHFYDLDMCINAYKLGFVTGVTNIHMTHMSHGDYRNPVWELSQDAFIKKWKGKE